MGRPVVHFEIIGRDPAALRDYYGRLFGWEYDATGVVAEEVSEPTDYGYIDRMTASDGAGIPGGIGGGPGYDGHVVFYVSVEDVAGALEEAERLGGRRRMGPVESTPGLIVGYFEDPEGHLIGVAGVS